jgi:hypothetical protein
VIPWRKNGQAPEIWQAVSTVEVAVPPPSDYIASVIGLTKQEQLVLCIVLGLLLTGWAVKTYRTARPPAATTTQAAR